MVWTFFYKLQCAISRDTAQSLVQVFVLVEAGNCIWCVLCVVNRCQFGNGGFTDLELVSLWHRVGTVAQA
jgi:hypothetical protein